MDRSEAKKKDQLPACPVETTLTLIGDKWKVLILRDLMPGTKRFGELRKSVGDVSQKVLTAQLRDMEKSGLVHREVYAEVTPRFSASRSRSCRSRGHRASHRRASWLKMLNSSPGRKHSSCCRSQVRQAVRSRPPLPEEP